MKEQEMARKLIFLTALMPLLTSAAEGRQSTLNMTCPQTVALIERQGAVVLSTGGRKFDRYVAHWNFCLPGEEAIPAVVPTASGMCGVGYTCQPRREDFIFEFPF